METVARLPTLDELRRHVLQVLCRNDHLDEEQTPLFQALVVQRDQPCGLFFEAQGPRLLKTHAVWAGDEHRILFYDCNGARFAVTHLSEAPDPCQVSPTQAPPRTAA